MLMTEKEAKEKNCPQGRTIVYGFDLSFNQMSMRPDVKEAKCTASDCMAWRWGSKIEPGQMIDTKDLSYEEVTDLIAERSDTKGYCGLAGRP